MPTPSESLPLVTLLLPAYNEAALLRPNFDSILAHLDGLGTRYRFEVLIVNDGSRDDTGRIADELAASHSIVRVIHHPSNGGLGKATRTGFRHAKGDYIVVLDIDLSYEPYHIERMLDRMMETQAQIVLASPYHSRGTVANVPRMRFFFSRWANRFLNIFAPGDWSTWTCMVRAYDAAFLRSLHLHANGMDIMPEIIRKGMILGAQIEEVPADLDWARQNMFEGKRTSSTRLGRQIIGTILSGFMLRPFTFLILPSLAVLVFGLFSSAFMFIHFFDAYAELIRVDGNADPTDALRVAYQENPHTYIVALLSLVLAIQLFGLGLIAFQAKRYFDDLFHLGSTIYSRVGQAERDTIEFGDQKTPTH